MANNTVGEWDIVKGHYSKEERRTQILRFLSDGKIRSTSEIAKALQMKGTTKFREMLMDLWREGHIMAYKEANMYRWQKPKLEQLALFSGGVGEIPF